MMLIFMYLTVGECVGVQFGLLKKIEKNYNLQNALTSKSTGINSRKTLILYAEAFGDRTSTKCNSSYLNM